MQDRDELFGREGGISATDEAAETAPVADEAAPAAMTAEGADASTEKGEDSEEKLNIPSGSEGKRATFAERMADAGYAVGRRYDAVKNAFLGYRPVKKGRTLRARISGGGETFTAGRKLLARLVLVGGYLRLFLALDPKAYNIQKYHHKDYTEVVRYAKTPFMIKLSSERQIRYAVELIDELMLANGFERDESYVPHDQADIFGAPRRRSRHLAPEALPGAPAVPVGIAAAVAPPDDEDDDEKDVGEPEAIDVRLPIRALVVDRKGSRVGRIRRSVWYDEKDAVNGEFRKEDTNVFLYSDETRSAYVDKNNNILTLGNEYVATIRRFGWLPVLLIVIILAVATVLSVLLSSYFLSRSGDGDYAPVLFVAHEDGTQWQDSENLPVFMNDTFGDSVIAPGMEGTYRFTLRNDNAHALVFALTFAEENEHGIGLCYKLKRDGAYVSGADGHIAVHELGVSDMTIEAGSSTIFELEWRWLDDDEADTAAGENGAEYTLRITFTAFVRG